MFKRVDYQYPSLPSLDTKNGKSVPEPKSGALVKMALSRFGEIGGFQFSKVKLNREMINATESDVKAVKSQVKTVPKQHITKASNHRFEFIILAISILSLFSVSMIICLMTILKISLPAFTRNRQSQIKIPSPLSPDINIIEYSVVPVEDAPCVARDTEFIYLTTHLK